MRSTSSILQCVENLRALLSLYEIPIPPVLTSQSDRVVYERNYMAVDRLDWLTTVGKFERWDFVANHGVSALTGWRERVAHFSMQIVLHRAALEVDVDIWNPNMGAGPAFLHGWECLIPGKTDPFKVAAGLRKRGLFIKDMRVRDGSNES